MKIKKSLGERTFDWFNYCSLTFFMVIILIPLWNTVILSFSDGSNFNQLGFNMWLDRWNTDSYKYVLQNEFILRAGFNTVARTVLTTVGFLLVTSLAAYALSKKELPFRTFLTIVILITMFFSGGLIPSYLIIRQLGLIDNFLVFVIPGLFSSFSCLIIRNFMMQTSKEVEESAFLDGAGYFTVFFRIMLPLSKPVLATVGLWTAVGQWNSWFDAYIYTRSDNLKVLQLILREMTVIDLSEASKMMQQVGLNNMNVVPDTVKGAVTLITIVPIIMLYPFIQKYFVKGIMIGSLKG